jgi:hypothetical protein
MGGQSAQCPLVSFWRRRIASRALRAVAYGISTENLTAPEPGHRPVAAWVRGAAPAVCSARSLQPPAKKKPDPLFLFRLR